MPVTIRDIARATNYSIGTVSRALKNQDGLSEKTRARIRAVARELGYDLGKLRQGELRRIAFLLHRQQDTRSSSAFYLPVLHGAEEACRKRGISLSFVVVGPAEPVVELVRVHQPDAMLCAGFFEPELLGALRDSGKPLVLLDMRLPGYQCVNPDHQLGGYLATRHLLRLGRKRVAMLCGSLAHHSILERSRGFRKALFEARMLADPELEVQLPSVGDPLANVRQAVDTLLALPRRPDALFCYNDSTALAAMQHCLERGLKVPHDLAIVGFDDIQAAGAAIPPLSSIAIDKEALGAMGIELLLEKNPAVDADCTLPVQLVVRESSNDD
ncbi:LacI family DNA-binding transcriptional regulator [Massilia sp. 9I]|uniref:LacI family DNA-binding transcriptional regulator n=1 Tax=Massilia sp. 9I TaxID=2653152 RepID=UPI0012F283E0|nr:LacI family DNA-binding transcriptional regulator [Massilia sp. 9I]VXB94635.1 Transcriptional regulator LacI family protein [Massilia sp. 9I]